MISSIATWRYKNNDTRDTEIRLEIKSDFNPKILNFNMGVTRYMFRKSDKMTIRWIALYSPFVQPNSGRENCQQIRRRTDYHYTKTILHSPAKKLKQILHTHAKRAIKSFQNTPVRLSNKYRLTGRQLWNSHNSHGNFRSLSIPIDSTIVSGTLWRIVFALSNPQSKRLK